MPHLELEKKKDVSAFRKIAIGTWRTAYDPSVYGTLELPMDKAVDYLQRFRAATGQRLTVSHMMAKAVAAALERMPDANAILRFHRIYLRKNINVFFQVVMTDLGEDKVDLSGAMIEDCDKKDLMGILTEFQEKVERVRSRKDPQLEKTRNSFNIVPFWMMHRVMRTISWLMYTLNLSVPGLPKDPFGSIMITNIGSLGLDTGFVPLVPYSRVPILLAMGAIKDVVVVEDGEMVVRKRMNVNATFDHRFIDGFHAAIMSKTLRTWFAEPDEHFGPIPGVAALEAPAETPTASADGAPVPAEAS